MLLPKHPSQDGSRSTLNHVSASTEHPEIREDFIGVNEIMTKIPACLTFFMNLASIVHDRADNLTLFSLRKKVVLSHTT